MRNRIYLIMFLTILLFSLINADSITGGAAQQPTDVSIFVLPGAPIIYIHSPENKTYYETSILLNYSIKNPLDNAWYSLDLSNNISLGNLSDNSLTFTTTQGSHTLYLFANNSYGTTKENTSFTVLSQEPPPSSSSGSGGGSGGGGGDIITTSFEINKDLIEVSMFKGETKTETIKITNTGDKALDITFELIDLEETLLIEENTIHLEKGETKEVNFHLFSLSKIFPGIFVGKIIVKVGQIEKSIHVIMEIKEREALFDINLEVLSQYKVASPGKKISVLLDMTNIGFKGTPTDVELYLFVTDLDKNILYESSKEMLAVKENMSIIRKLEVPFNIGDGTYIVLGEIKYQEFTASSYDTFDVVKRQGLAFSWWLLIILAIVIALIIMLILYLSKLKKQYEEPGLGRIKGR